MVMAWRKIVKKMVVWAYCFFSRFPRIFSLLVTIVKWAVPIKIREGLKRIIRTGDSHQARTGGDISGFVSLSPVDFIEETDLTFKILKDLENKNRENSH